MTQRDPEFEDLLQRVRQGSAAAASELVERYGAHLLRVIRRKLHPRLRSKFDSQDFLQAVWASFFALPAQNHAFEKPEALIAFLCNLARNKVVDTVRQRLMSQKYNVNREQSVQELCSAGEGELLAQQPTPSAIAIAREEWERLLRDEPEHYQRMLVLLRAGQSRQEVAQQLGVNERTIRRVLDKLAGKIKHEPQ